ncbi:hypothetical protein EBU71_20660, partial [bacterium]|nr:hypothetical protein [Candidatus Elulimicrobium humile]
MKISKAYDVLQRKDRKEKDSEIRAQNHNGGGTKGSFKLFYRQSNATSYNITPAQMSNISFDITYVNKTGQTHTLTILAGLNYPVTNASGAESDADIKLKAPQVYYSQNRMITGEDYNILPLTAGTDILKVKTVNRVSSGISRYYELSDVSGKYSNVNVFATDGIIYKETNQYSFEYELGTKNEIRTAIRTNLKNIVTSKEFRSFYYDRFTRPSFEGYNIKWIQGTKTTNQSTGYFEIDELGINQYTPVPVGEYSSNNLKYATEGALIKFKAPLRADPTIINNTSTQQTYFLPNGKLTFKADNSTSEYRWSKVVNIVLDGYNEGKGLLSSGLGPVTITGSIPSDAVPGEVIPKFVSVISEALETEIINLSLTKGNFGLG